MKNIYKVIALLMVLTASIQSKAQSYCIPSLGNNASFPHYITQVSMANINNTSGGSYGDGYVDHTYNTTINVMSGFYYPLTLKAGPGINEYFAIYIDFNDDGDFTDPNELVMSIGYASSVSNPTINANITIPTGTPSVVTRMRVLCVNRPTQPSSYTVPPCVTGYRGECEDYNIAIDGATETSYCSPYYSSGTAAGKYIASVNLNTIHNNNSNIAGAPYYTDYTSTYSTTLTPGATYPMSIKAGPSQFGQKFAVYFDYNGDLDFTDTYELAYVFPEVIGADTILNFNVNVPASLNPIATRMRVVCADSYDNPYSVPLACPFYNTSGEVEDYKILIGGGNPPVAAFTASTTNVLAGNSANFTDQSTNNPASWAWTFAGGTPASSTSQNPTNIIYNTAGCYAVTLVATNFSGSNTKTQTCYITVNAPFNYCVPIMAGGPDVGDFINGVSLGSINNQNTGSITGLPYYNYTSQSTTLSVNTTYTLTVQNGDYNSDTIAAWIDYNNDLDFYDAGEKLGQLETFSSNDFYTINFTVPSNVSAGTKRLRVSLAYNAAGIANMNPCTNYEYGETEDYSVVIASNAPVAAFTANTTNIQPGGSVNFTDQSTNTPTSWSWTFSGGNPSTSSAQNPTNISYAALGCYLVSLTATNASGNNTSTQTCYINVTAQPVGCNELFFSEYIEGTASNKALEIYNPTSSAINLATYSVEMYANGASTATNTLALSGSIAANDVFVIANSAANAAILAQADVTNAVCSFNGNDAVVLKKNGIVIDVIGEVGVNPGTSWVVGTATTLDYTLVRNANVIAPSNSWATAQTQWTSYTVNTTTYLGSDSSSCFGTGVGIVKANLNASNIHISPNPFTDAITVQSNKLLQGESYKIIDNLGRIIISEKFNSTNTIDLSSLAQGIYFLRVNEQSFKLIKQ